MKEDEYYWCWKCNRTHSVNSEVGRAHLFQRDSKEGMLQPPKDEEVVDEGL